jgi:hypothetical protein
MGLMGSRRLALTGLVMVCVLVGVLFWSAVALAAPEKPVTEAAGSVGANTAVLNGELNASILDKAGWYFAYNTGGTCLGGGATARSEEEAEVSKKVSADVSGLEPGTTYTVCLVAYNGLGEETEGSPQTFTTGVSQPVIDSEYVSSLGSSTATVEAQVNPEKQLTTCLRFEYGETSAYGSSTPCTPGSLGEAFGDQPASASLEKLKFDTTYHFRVVVENDSSPSGGTDGPDESFQTLPLLENQAFSAVGSDSATFSANLNVYHVPVTYFFEYGTTSAYGSSTPVEDTGAIEGTTVATASPEGLTPGAEYHFRMVAKADGEIVMGADTVFKTLPAGIQGLPDGRVFEMVTPVDKENAEVSIPDALGIAWPESEGIVTLHLFQVAADGDSVVYQGEPTHNGEAGAQGTGLGSPYLAKRMAGGGWEQASIASAGHRFGRYQGFSSDLTTGVVESPTESPEDEPLPGGKAPECYRERKKECIDLYFHPLGEEDYQPLFTAMPHRANLEEFQALVGASGENGSGKGHAVYAGGSADMSQLLFEVDDALLEGGGALESELGDDLHQEQVGGEFGDYLYDWHNKELSLVDVLPDGKLAPDATFGASPVPAGVSHKEARYANQFEYARSDFSHDISADGSRVFWSVLEGNELKGLYVRENATQPQSPLNGQDECSVVADACTVQIDKEVGGGGRFWTASDDGSRAFFTKGSLYEYEVGAVTGQSGVLTDLTPGVEVQGVIGASEDGNYVYYVDNANELFVLHMSSSGWEAPKLIATLSTQDGLEVRPFQFEVNFQPVDGDWATGMGLRTAEVTPDGRGLVFMSAQSLKVQGFPDGYQNDGNQEVYVYDAGDGSLSCASCSPSGEPPQIPPAEEFFGAASFLPVSWNDSYTPTWISEDGDRVFFDSFVPLVSRDTNGKLDVYEWEREGTGTCGSGQGVDGGCISLLSGGTSSDSSYLLGASTNGDDVFIITRDNLTSDAGDELYKVFDARVGGVVPVVPPACTGTGCQGVPAPPPTFATPSSVTYEGVGNFPPPSPAPLVKTKNKSLTRAQKLAKALAACKGKPKKKRSSCEAIAKKRYGPKGGVKGSHVSKRGRK